MKAFCMIPSCLLAVALADRAQEDAQAARELAECKKDMGIPELKDPGQSSMDDVSEDKKPCLYFCLFKKHGMMRENGTVDKKEFIYHVLESKRERMEKTIEKCEEKIQPVDGCKMAACMVAAAEKRVESVEDEKTE